MNILHWKYAIEVERTRSINRAAENLFMGQPNLSRAIKELEESLGITIFKRTSKGMSPTPQGEEFLQHAKKILSQIDEVEALYNTNHGGRVRFFRFCAAGELYCLCLYVFFRRARPCRRLRSD